jgi:hypothetical protein
MDFQRRNGQNCITLHVGVVSVKNEEMFKNVISHGSLLNEVLVWVTAFLSLFK